MEAKWGGEMLKKLGNMGVIAGLILVASAAIAEVNVRERLAGGQPPVFGSWRATGGGYPENSLAGIQHSLNIGAGIVDLHVQLTGDGEHIVFHHARLDHSTNVKTVFPDGPSGGPTRQERGGLDYTRDYTLEEVRQLHLMMDDEVTEHTIPSLTEALDLINGRLIVVLNLQEFDLEKLKAELVPRPTGHILAYSIDPYVVRDVVNATGVAGYVSISQSRLFETEPPQFILEAASEVLGDDLVLAHVKRARLLTPELLTRAKELGVGLSVSGYGKEDMALGDSNDPSAWFDTLGKGAIVHWTTIPDQLLTVLDR